MKLKPTIRADVSTWADSTLASKREAILDRLDRLESGELYSGMRGWAGRHESSYRIEHGQLEADLALVDEEIARRA
jgi:hypothetical protein